MTTDASRAFAVLPPKEQRPGNSQVQRTWYRVLKIWRAVHICVPTEGVAGSELDELPDELLDEFFVQFTEPA